MICPFCQNKAYRNGSDAVSKKYWCDHCKQTLREGKDPKPKHKPTN